MSRLDKRFMPWRLDMLVANSNAVFQLCKHQPFPEKRFWSVPICIILTEQSLTFALRTKQGVHTA